ncbi:MAG: F0F1 ATP synthase subunit B [Bacillota bacterium]
MESIISDFHVDWHLLVAQAVNFGIVISVLYFFAFKPIVKMMADRSARIAQGLKDAEDSRTKLSSTEQETQGMLKDARKQADAVVAEAGRQAEASQAEAVIKAKEQVKSVIEQEKSKLAREKEQTMEEIRLEASALAVSLAEKVLGEKLDAQGDEKFINKVIK